MREYTKAEVEKMIMLLKEALDTGHCRQANARERAMLATAYAELASKIDAAFPEMAKWYCGRLYGPGDERPPLPPCAASMGCLCAGHARGDAVTSPCNTDERG